MFLLDTNVIFELRKAATARLMPTGVPLLNPWDARMPDNHKAK